MTRIQQLSIGLASVLVAATLIGFDSTSAMACSTGSSGSGVSHGSKVGSGSVTVCVGASSSTAGTKSTQTITKTVTVPVSPKTKPAPKPQAKPTSITSPKPVVQAVSCPSAAQMASMPRSADAAERWVQSICPTAPKAVAASKSTPKPAAKTKTITITETITVDVPGQSSSAADAVEFQPNPLVASVFPDKVLSLRQLAKFSSNPSSHFGSALVLGRQAEVHFLPIASSWSFSDGVVQTGVDTERAFQSAGKYQIRSLVEYSVSYRLLGESSWQLVEGTLFIESNQLEVKVGAFNFKADQDSQGALLVGADCLGRIGAFGCDI